MLRSTTEKMYDGVTKTSAVVATSMEKERTYKIEETARRIKKQVAKQFINDTNEQIFGQDEVQRRSTYRRRLHSNQSNNETYI